MPFDHFAITFLRQYHTKRNKQQNEHRVLDCFIKSSRVLERDFVSFMKNEKRRLESECSEFKTTHSKQYEIFPLNATLQKYVLILSRFRKLKTDRINSEFTFVTTSTLNEKFRQQILKRFGQGILMTEEWTKPTPYITPDFHQNVTPWILEKVFIAPRHPLSVDYDEREDLRFQKVLKWDGSIYPLYQSEEEQKRKRLYAQRVQKRKIVEVDDVDE